MIKWEVKYNPTYRRHEMVKGRRSVFVTQGMLQNADYMCLVFEKLLNEN